MSEYSSPIQTGFCIFVVLSFSSFNSVTASELTPGTTSEEPAPTEEPDSNLPLSTKLLLIKVHGLCLIFAWFFCVSVSVFGARYLRNFLPETTPFGLKLWFHIHRSLNLIALVLMAVGLLIIFFVHEWRWHGPKVGGGADNTSAEAMHALFGVLSVSIAVIQPFNSLFRCGPQHANRKYFNWFHRGLGILCWLLAATTITIACKKFGEHFVNDTVAVSLVAVFLAFVGASVCVAEVFKYKYGSHTQDVDVEEPQPIQEQVKRVQWRTQFHSHLFFVFTSVALTVCTVFIMCIKSYETES